MRELLPDLERWQARGERVALATVVATRHSAPRPVGSKLAVSEGGELAGSVSGGCVENEVYEYARDILRGAPPRLLTFGISDDEALQVGLPCGGEIDVFVAVPDTVLLKRLMSVVEGNERAVGVTVLAGAMTGAQVLVLEDGDTIGAPHEALTELGREVLTQGGSGVRELGAETLFAELYEPLPRLVVIGAVDLAEALCRMTHHLGWKTVVADPRAQLTTRERIPSADELFVAWPDEAIERAAPDTSSAIVVLTHEERFDVPALTAALATDAFYVGALGSRRTQAKRRNRLSEQGVSEEDLDRIAGPCGLDLGAGSPAETAISIVGEILAVRAGRQGGRLRASPERIHAGAV